MISEWQQRFTYKDSGRGPSEVDCFGFARIIRHEQFDAPLLPSREHVDPRDKQAAGDALLEVGEHLTPCKPEHGAFALCYIGTIAWHCGVVWCVDGRLGVVECDYKRGVRWMPLRKFERLFTRVEYYA
ncbi:MAG: hypothetical protein CMH22_15960 [Methylophaga sp.]|nr:hypothetical protein [Methylophaga sp.]MAX53471.1 hypothetical protein [Methylophaga sp.]|tara:strand:- start:10451 stop:10834 length:384 start_codon:yes stop_codon:yes gene_type:complete